MSNWIKCSDQLPEIGKEVLIRIPTCGQWNVEGGSYRGDGIWDGAWCSTRGEGRPYKVLEWSEMPGPLCAHEWTDDGEFTLACTACGAKEDYTQALQHAFELGGTDDGAYHLEADELCEVLRLHSNQKGD